MGGLQLRVKSLIFALRSLVNCSPVVVPRSDTPNNNVPPLEFAKATMS